MTRFRWFTAVAIAVISLGAAAIAAAPAATASGLLVRRACSAATGGRAGCFALQVSGSGHVSAFAGPAGYHPADLISAYALNATKGSGQTIAIVDAYDNPKAEADLGVYRSTFGLPACTTANGCFAKVDQNGLTAPLPVTDSGWGLEIALDVDMASAICPNCKILLVEATEQLRQPRRGGEPGGRDGRDGDLEQLRRW